MDSLDSITKENFERIVQDISNIKNKEEYDTMILYQNEPVHIRLKYNNAGFWSIFNKLMNYLFYYKNIQKIDFDVSYPPEKYEAFYGREEFFSHIFEVYDTSSKDILHVVHAERYLTYESTGGYANTLHVVDTSWRKIYNELFTKYIKIKPEIIQGLDVVPSDKKVISILVRHPDLKHEQINNKMPSFSQYDAVIEKLLRKYNNNVVFILVTDVVEAEIYFKSKYSQYEIIHPFSLKTSIKTSEAQMKYNGDKTLASLAVQTVLLLAKGDDFLFPNSNMATAALYINPIMNSHFLIG